MLAICRTHPIRCAYGLLAGVVGVVYLTTLCPGAFWLDSSEFIAGSYSLGIVHPPGHPLFVMLGKLFALVLPFADIGFRVNLLSATLGVTCSILVAEIVRRLSNDNSPWSLVGAVSAGALFAFTQAAWMQSVRAEVYTLNCALILTGLLMAIRWYRTRSNHTVYAFAVLTGMALCNHHYLVFFFLPAPLLLLMVTQEGRQLLASKRILWAALLTTTALLCYAYLPVRALTDPVINWGDPSTVQRFVDTLTAKTFQSSVDSHVASIPLLDNVFTAIAMMLEQINPVGFLAGILGLGLLLNHDPKLGLLLTSALCLNVLTKGIMWIDPDNPDDYGYFMLSIAILCIGSGLLPSLLRQHSLAAVAALALLAGAGTLAHANFEEMDLSDEQSAEHMVDATLERLPPNAVVLVNYFGLLFNHWYADIVLGRRPDIALVQSTFDSKRYEGRPYVRSIRTRYPFLSPVLDSFQVAGNFPFDALETLAAKRPVFVEPFPENAMPPEPLETTGIVRQIGASPPTDGSLDLAHLSFWKSLDAKLALGRVHKEAQKVLIFTHFVHCVLALRQGHSSVAESHINMARSLGTKSQHFSALEEKVAQLKASKEKTLFRSLDASKMIKK